MIVDATRIVTTQGMYLGESGTGYQWGVCQHPGDFSRETRGRIQGRREPCRIEIIVKGAVLEEPANRPMQLALFVPGQKWGLNADDAILLGYARVVE